jgi:hypothetical protein
MCEEIPVRYDHLPQFHDLPGPAIFAMAMDICNPSQAFDIEGSQDKFEALTYADYPGENVIACATMAQKTSRSYKEYTHLPIAPYLNRWPSS